MHTIDQLIHAKWLISGEENAPVLSDHSLAIHHGKIIDIKPTAAIKTLYHATHEQTFPAHAIMPGLINAHTHIAMNVFRGLADDLELMDWLNNYIWPAETKWVSHEMVYDASLLAMAEMIRSGTTCFNDMYFFPAATAEAAKLAGIRAHIGMTIISVPTAWAKTTADYFAKSLEFYQQYKNHELIVPTFAPHSTYTVALPDLIKVNELAHELDVKINIHLHEAPSEIAQSLATYQQRPLARLNDIKMISPRLIAIHMTQIDDEDAALLKQHKPHTVHCPESNMKLASGGCPVVRLQTLGINVALGTDGAASNNDLDMLGEMRSATFLSKVTMQDPKALPAHTVINMATLNGARALGIEQHTGTITVGKSADFIAIDLDELETQPLYHPISQIVYSACRQQVTDVWVAGKQLLKNRELLTLDEKELLAKAKYWKEKIS